MNRWRSSILAALLLAFAPALASGCGGGGSSATEGGTAVHRPGSARAPGSEDTGPGPARAKAHRAGPGHKTPPPSASEGGTRQSGASHFTPPPHHDSGGGAAQFRTKGGDNSIQEYGGEAPSWDFEEAAAALHGYLDARAARDWAAACSYMASGVVASLHQLAAGSQGEGDGSGKPPSCAQLLATVSAGLPPAALRDAAIADVGALRADGSRAFLLFHGAQGANYFVPMTREGGTWRVAALAPSALG